MARRIKKRTNNDDDSTEFPLNPSLQIELEIEKTCCVTGEPIEYSFCRFPDYVNGTLMVMSKSAMLQHMQAGTSVAKFKEILVERHGEQVLAEHYANY